MSRGRLQGEPDGVTDEIFSDGKAIMPGSNFQLFLDGGTLPFTGRSAEMERILEFLGTGPEGNGLRAGLITAEGGAGKSRLIEECIRRSAAQERGIIRAKLRPEGIASIGALLAPALWGSDSAGPLLKREPLPTLPSVLAGLRRVAGLRRTLLVIEDVHLLEGATLREFGSLLEQLADDSLILLCTARPGPSAVREALRPHLYLDLRLEPLSRRDLAALWQDLFSLPPDPQTLEALRSATLGNPLALRSALRGAVNSGAILPEPGGANVAPEAFADVVRRSAERLTQGMIAHLNEDTRRNAELLARLGESFSTEAAAALLGSGWEETVRSLKEEGILIDAETPSAPLNGGAGGRKQIAFSHSLLHNSLAAGAAPDPARFLAVVESGAPLCSVLPYQTLSGITAVPPDFDAGRIAAVIDRIREAALTLNRTGDWPYGLTLCAAGEAIRDAFDWPEEKERLRTDLGLTMLKITLLRQRNSPQVYAAPVRHALEASERLLALDPASSRYRLYALIFFQEYLFHSGNPAHRDVREQVEELLGDFPDLRFGDVYLEFLREAFHFAGSQGDGERIRLIENELTRFLEAPEVGPELRDRARLNVGKYLLMYFETAQDLKNREELLNELERLDGGDLRRRPWTVEYLLRTGRSRRTIRECDRILPHFRETSLRQSYHNAFILKLAAMVLEGEPVERVLKLWSAESGQRVAEEGRVGETVREYADTLLSALLLRGEREGAQRFLRSDGMDAARFSPPCRVLLAAESEKREEGKEGKATSGSDSLQHGTDIVQRFAEELERTGTVAAATLAQAAAAIRPLPLELRDIVLVSAFLAATGRRGMQGGVAPEFVESVLRPAAIAGLRWCRRTGLEEIIPPLLRRAAFLLSPDERQEWERKREEKKAHKKKKGEETPTPPLHIGMFGAVTARQPGGEPVRIRGGRNQVLLGTLVADLLRDEPLDRIDFTALATGDAGNPDKARRSMNVAVLRLREAIGREAIITDGDTPRLNTDYAAVDFLEAYDALRTVRRSLRARELLPARIALARVLRLWKGRVPFPGLYADLFEELREQFETRTRNAVVAVGAELLGAEDYIAAEELLAEAFAILPEDEEVRDLLQQTLQGLGKPADSQWVAIRAAEEER